MILCFLASWFLIQLAVGCSLSPVKSVADANSSTIFRLFLRRGRGFVGFLGEGTISFFENARGPTIRPTADVDDPKRRAIFSRVKRGRNRLITNFSRSEKEAFWTIFAGPTICATNLHEKCVRRLTFEKKWKSSENAEKYQKMKPPQFFFNTHNWDKKNIYGDYVRRSTWKKKKRGGKKSGWPLVVLLPVHSPRLLTLWPHADRCRTTRGASTS